MKTVKEVIETKKHEDDDEEDDDEDKRVYEYSCPLFKTSKRTSKISASGRSDEHIISIVFYFIKL